MRAFTGSPESASSNSSDAQRKLRWLDFFLKVVGPLLSRSNVAVELPLVPERILVKTTETDAANLFRVADVKHAPRIPLNAHGIARNTGLRKIKSSVIEVGNYP